MNDFYQTWDRGIRVDRLPHNHILQSEDGVDGCLACDSIDPFHLTDIYSQRAIYGG